MKKFIFTKEEISEAIQIFIDSAPNGNPEISGESIVEGMFEYIDEDLSEYYGNDITNIDKVITDQVDKLPIIINAMEPKDRGSFLIALMKYRDQMNDFEY